MQTEISICDSEKYYNPAYTAVNGIIYMNYLSIEGIYLTAVSCFIYLFGNTHDTIAMCNMFLECLSLFFIYFAAKRLNKSIFAFIVTLLCTGIPFYGELPVLWGDQRYITLWKEDRIIYLAIALTMYVFLLLSYVIAVLIARKRLTEEDDDKATKAKEESNASGKRNVVYFNHDIKEEDMKYDIEIEDLDDYDTDI